MKLRILPGENREENDADESENEDNAYFASRCPGVPVFVHYIACHAY